MKARSTKVPPNPVHEDVQKLSHAFDDYTDKQDVAGILKTIEAAEKLALSDALNHISFASLYYSIATAYSDLSYASSEYQNDKNIEKQLYYFRLSISQIELQELTNDIKPYLLSLKFNLFTNYASTLDAIGRTIEALNYYKNVLQINSTFGMTLGNIGVAYLSYGILVYDPSQRDILNCFAYHYLKDSLRNTQNMSPEAIDCFKNHLQLWDKEYIKQVLEPGLTIPKYSLGESAEEHYRKWALGNNLFINPMNDLPIIENFIAADVLGMPNIVVNVKDGMNYKYHGMYNNLKQEYISARYLFYEATQLLTEPHYADKDTYLINTLDYPSYSIRIEKIKLAFRSLYSLFDKVSFFINEYFDLGIEERDINYRSIWLEKKSGKKGYDYKNILMPQKNSMLNALCWLMKDLYVPLYQSPSPEAKELCDLRNCLEHKYLKVYNEIFPDHTDGRTDNLAVYVSETKLEIHVLKLLHMTRELIIYLALSININEIQKKEENAEEFIPQISLDDYDDEWKY